MRAMLLALSLLATPAEAGDPFIAQAFHFSGVCDGTDQVEKWQIDGRAPGTWYITPWLPYSISIVAIELVKFSGNSDPVGPSFWWMVGSTGFSSGDTMLFMSPTEDHVYREFPSGRTNDLPAGPVDYRVSHIDLHGGCLGGGPVNFWMTLYYYPNTPARG